MTLHLASGAISQVLLAAQKKKSKAIGSSTAQTGSLAGTDDRMRLPGGVGIDHSGPCVLLMQEASCRAKSRESELAIGGGNQS
jgi:hypothetical protein